MTGVYLDVSQPAAPCHTRLIDYFRVLKCSNRQRADAPASHNRLSGIFCDLIRAPSALTHLNNSARIASGALSKSGHLMPGFCIVPRTHDENPADAEPQAHRAHR